MSPIYLLIMGFMLLGQLAGTMLRRRFQEYSQIPIGLTGREVAEKMLRDNNINDVRVIHVAGQLTDHYNPQDKTVNLSEVVYNSNSVAAAAVAAHECGHAVQHANAYPFLQFRSALVPVVQISTNLSQILLSIGVMVLVFSGYKIVLLLGVILFAAGTLFSFMTLPVEFDASARALRWLESKNILGANQDKAFTALKWAASTYVVAALSSLASLLYYASMLFRNRER
ncbi:MAG: zinc metallopeptidase [Chitinophagales bacterium]|jgi:Zn-dependent membrane protease YugP|nr:zinc metallopeptidase [Chitinophagales bacterium]